MSRHHLLKGRVVKLPLQVLSCYHKAPFFSPLSIWALEVQHRHVFSWKEVNIFWFEFSELLQVIFIHPLLLTLWTSLFSVVMSHSSAWSLPVGKLIHRAMSLMVLEQISLVTRSDRLRLCDKPEYTIWWVEGHPLAIGLQRSCWCEVSICLEQRQNEIWAAS